MAYILPEQVGAAALQVPVVDWSSPPHVIAALSDKPLPEEQPNEQELPKALLLVQVGVTPSTAVCVSAMSQVIAAKINKNELTLFLMGFFHRRLIGAQSSPLPFVFRVFWVCVHTLQLKRVQHVPI